MLWPDGGVAAAKIDKSFCEFQCLGSIADTESLQAHLNTFYACAPYCWDCLWTDMVLNHMSIL